MIILGSLEKRVVDCLLVLIELFSLRFTAEALRANIGSKSAISLQRGPVDPKLGVTIKGDAIHAIFQINGPKLVYT